jgi:hypothetical protein
MGTSSLASITTIASLGLKAGSDVMQGNAKAQELSFKGSQYQMRAEQAQRARDRTAVRMHAIKAGRYGHLLSRRFLRSIAFLGGRAYAQKDPAKRRREIARNAALARWSDIKAAVKPA